MSVTLETSHLEMSPLNSRVDPPKDLVFSNNPCISVRVETFQDPIGPCGPLEQSVESFRHFTIVACSSALEFGVHSAVEYYHKGCAVRFKMRLRIIFRLGFRSRMTLRNSDRARVRWSGSV